MPRSLNHRYIDKNEGEPSIWYPGGGVIPDIEYAVRALLNFHDNSTTLVRTIFEDGSALEWRYDPEAHDGLDT